MKEISFATHISDNELLLGKYDESGTLVAVQMVRVYVYCSMLLAFKPGLPILVVGRRSYTNSEISTRIYYLKH